MSWKDLFETIYYLAGSIASVGTLAAALFALSVYKQNSRLERARWASSLYEKFFEKDDLKFMRDALDCSVDSDEVSQTVANEDARFTDYLNFFEYIAFLKDSKQLQLSEVEGLFGYYLDCLERHQSVKTYIANPEKGFEGLAKLIGARK